jgi:hypothetical protein
MAFIGDVLNVIGKRSAIVPDEPIPGRTPINVPIKTPKKQRSKLFGSKITEKPKKIL